MKRKLLATVGLAACAALSAQLPESEHISVASSASVRVMPDMATIEVSVEAKDMDAAKAKAVVDERSAKIIELVNKLGVANEDITAAQIAISPNIEWAEKTPVDKGTEVSRGVTIVLRDLSRYGELVQGLVGVPISSLGYTRVDTTRREEAQAEALAKAIEGAKAKAKKTAEQFGARLGAVYSISEKSVDYSLAQEIAMHLDQGMPAGRVGTFEPGMMQISAEVHAVFRIKPGK